MLINIEFIRPESSAASDGWKPIVIRTSDDRDARRLALLAGLDSRKLPAGSFLLAEVDGELVAAVPLDTNERAIADPFRPTAHVVKLLELQARELRRTDETRRARPLPPTAARKAA